LLELKPKVLGSECEESAQCTDDCGEYRDPSADVLRILGRQTVIFILVLLVIARLVDRLVDRLIDSLVDRLIDRVLAHFRCPKIHGSYCFFSCGNGGACEGESDCGCAGNKCSAGEKLHNEIL